MIVSKVLAFIVMNFTVFSPLGPLTSLMNLVIHDTDLQTGGSIKYTNDLGFWIPPVCHTNALLLRQKTLLTRGQSFPTSRWGQPGEEGYICPMSALPRLIFSYAVGF